MADIDKTYRIFVSAAEVSGDSHCAGLITALQKINPNIEFVGVGGEQMSAAGCKLLENTADKAAMIHNAFGQIFRFIKLIRKIKQYLKKNKVDLVIVCDSPAFNFHVAAAAKRLSIKTLFYVAPQLWAWAPWRIKKLKKYCDKLCCILPFEQDWFEQAALDADIAIVASGSATLQVAAAGCPMVVMYQSNKILWHTVGRWLVKGKFLSLVNILAKRRLVPEFMPYFDSIEPISEAVEQMLTESANLSVLSGELIELVEPLRQINASENTAQIALEMLKND